MTCYSSPFLLLLWNLWSRRRNATVFIVNCSRNTDTKHRSTCWSQYMYYTSFGRLLGTKWSNSAYSAVKKQFPTCLSKDGNILSLIPWTLGMTSIFRSPHCHLVWGILFLNQSLGKFELYQMRLYLCFPVCLAPHSRKFPWPDSHHSKVIWAGLLHPHDGGKLWAVGSAGEGGWCQTVQVSSQQKLREKTDWTKYSTSFTRPWRFVTFKVLHMHRSRNSIYRDHKCMTFHWMWNRSFFSSH